MLAKLIPDVSVDGGVPHLQGDPLDVVLHPLSHHETPDRVLQQEENS
jgi:hypothetical protein